MTCPSWGVATAWASLAPRSARPWARPAMAKPIGGVDCTVTEAGGRRPAARRSPGAFRALVGHKEAVEALPEGAVHLVASDTCPFQMIRAGRNVLATQFHPEAQGENFANRIEIYKHRGYFAPPKAEALTAACLAEVVTVPQLILSAFRRKMPRGGRPEPLKSAQ